MKTFLKIFIISLLFSSSSFSATGPLTLLNNTLVGSVVTIQGSNYLVTAKRNTTVYPVPLTYSLSTMYSVATMLNFENGYMRDTIISDVVDNGNGTYTFQYSRTYYDSTPTTSPATNSFMTLAQFTPYLQTQLGITPEPPPVTGTATLDSLDAKINAIQNQLNIGLAGGSGTMPSELTGYLTQSNYNYIMGQTGLICGFVVLLIWSRGL